MRHAILIFLLAILSDFAVAQNGLKFREIALSEALAAAKAENKLVFMELHTDGCGACEFMAAEVFPREDMGAYFNDRFVCVSYNLSRDENKPVRQQYPVSVVPTFFLLRPDGSVYHKFVGAAPSTDFIAAVEKAMDERNAYSTLEKRYREGNVDKATLMAFAIAADNAAESKMAKEAVQKLRPLLTLQDSLSEAFAPLLDLNKPENRRFFHRHVDALRQTWGDEKVEQALAAEYTAKIKDCIPFSFGETPRPDFSAVKAEIAAAHFADRQFLLDELELLEAACGGQPVRSVELLRKILREGRPDHYFVSLALYCVLDHGDTATCRAVVAMRDSILEACQQTLLTSRIRKTLELIGERAK